MANLYFCSILLTFLAFNVNKSSQKLYYKPTPFEDGLLDKEILLTNPQLSFIGQINDKFYYWENTTMNWYDATDYCKSLGMALAYFDSLEESDFVFVKVPSIDMWTDGVMAPILTNFYWKSKGTVVPTHTFTFDENSDVALTLIGHSGLLAGALSQHLKSDARFYPLCILERSKF